MGDHRDLLSFNAMVRKPSPIPDQGRTLQPLKDWVEDAEKMAITQMLEITSVNRTQAAKNLGIGRRTLYDKIEIYGIK